MMIDPVGLAGRVGSQTQPGWPCESRCQLPAPFWGSDNPAPLVHGQQVSMSTMLLRPSTQFVTRPFTIGQNLRRRCRGKASLPALLLGKLRGQKKRLCEGTRLFVLVLPLCRDRYLWQRRGTSYHLATVGCFSPVLPMYRIAARLQNRRAAPKMAMCNCHRPTARPAIDSRGCSCGSASKLMEPGQDGKLPGLMMSRACTPDCGC